MGIYTKGKKTSFFMALIMLITLALPTAANAENVESAGFTQTAPVDLSQPLLDDVTYTNIIVSYVGELQDAVNNALEDTAITLNSSFVFDSATLSMPNVNIIIDGGDMTWSTGSIKVQGNQAGSLTIQNMKMNDASAIGKLLTNVATAGQLFLKNMKIYDSTNGAIDISTSGEAKTILSRVHLYDNEASNSAPAIWLGSEADVEINNSTIESNTGRGDGSQGGGAISARNYAGSLKINNSVFRGNINRSSSASLVGGGGGAICIFYFYGNIEINESIFENNQTNGEGTIAESYDGGAIYVLDGRGGATLKINKTTFNNNIAHDDGGAMMIQGTANPGLTTTITNSTFYGNKAYGLNGTDYAGGAIQFFKNGGSAKMVNNVLSCTFVNNQAGNESSITEQRGGAIALEGAGIFAQASVTRNNSLFIGNKVYGTDGLENTSSNYKDISNTATTQAGTTNVINVDKGEASPVYTIEDVLGKNAVLCENQSNIRAGVDDEIVKTIPFKPGSIANNTYNGASSVEINGVDTPLPSEDQRGFNRTKDQGAVDLSWIKYNANGGTFNLPDLPLYEGIVYYERDAQSGQILDYYNIGSINGDTTILSETYFDLSRAGYRFLGWSKDENAESPDTTYAVGNNIQYVQDDITLYAVWAEIHTVSYIANGGTGIMDDGTQYHGATYTVQSNGFSAPVGTNFAGWNTQADGSGTAYGASDTFVLDSDVTLYAQWKLIPYTVSYDSNGGAGSMISDTQDYGTTYTVRSNGFTAPVGRSFNGWNTQANGSGTAYETSDTFAIYSDITLYAQWKLTPYTVSYASNGGTGFMTSDTQDYGTTYTVRPSGFTAPIGRSFNGWNTQPDGSGTAYAASGSFEITSNVTLYAQWKLIPYTVSYASNGGTGIMTSDTQDYGTTYTVRPSGFTAPIGRSFAEWNTQVDGSGTAYGVSDSFVITSGVTLYAQWKLIPYTVSYDSNGGTGTMTSDTQDYGTTYTVRPSGFTAPIGKTVAGWNTEPDGSGTAYGASDTFVLDSDVTLYAQWKLIPYTVSYDSNGGTGAMTSDTQDYGTTYILRSNGFTAPIGRSFNGWNTQPDGSGTAYAATDTFVLSSNMTLYAQWNPIPYTVSYAANGSTGTMAGETQYYGTTYTVRPNGFAVPVGTYFAGWNTHQDGTGITYTANDSFTMNSDITLYAQWEPIPSTVNYVANGGTGAMAADTQNYGTTYTVRSNGFAAPVGTNFAGWNTRADGSGTSYTASNSFTLFSDITLYAQWLRLYTVSYHPNGSTGTMTPVTLSEGTSYSVQPNRFAAPIGMSFTGWNTSPDGSGTSYAANDSLILGSSVTLYAQWAPASEATHTVTYDPNGGTGTMESDTQNSDNTYTVRPNEFTAPSGKTFTRWNTQADGSGVFYDTNAVLVLNSDIILYAQWAPASEATHTVSYDSNGGTGSMTSDTQDYGTTYTVRPNGFIAPSGKTFTGWNTQADGSGTAYAASDTFVLDSNVNLYARWGTVSSLDRYTLTVQAETGGCVNTTVNGSYDPGDAVTITAEPYAYYTFSGWTSNVSGILDNTTSTSTTLTMPSCDVTVKANFTYVGGGGTGGEPGGGIIVGSRTYSVTYDANGGTGSHKVADIESGALHNVLPLSVTGISNRDGIFNGWNTARDGSGTSYTAGDGINITADVTLYAQWSDKGSNGVGAILETENHGAYINGYSDGTVKPDSEISRAEVAVIFYRLLKEQGSVSGSRYTDVNDNAWYAQAVNYLSSINVLNGYSDGTFRPNEKITRAEFAAVVSRFDNLSSASNIFIDVTINHWAVDYINSAYAKGWILGYTDGTFRPDNRIIRSEAVTLINNVLNREVDSETLKSIVNPYGDLQSYHWAYTDIIEASIPHSYHRDDNHYEVWTSW